MKPASAKVKREWDEANEREPELMKAERERLKTRPLDRSRNPRRTGPLTGKLATKSVGGTKLPHWQHEITGAGRLWYCPDKDAHIVWVTKVALSHPKETD